MIKKTLATFSVFTAVSAFAGQQIHVDLDGFYPTISMTMLTQSLENEIAQEAIRICGSLEAVDHLGSLRIGPVQDAIRGTDVVSAEVHKGANGHPQIAYMSYTKTEATAEVVCKP